MATNDCKDCKDCIDCQDLPVKHGGCLPVIVVALLGATLVGLSVFAGGCSTAQSSQPAKSQTQNNTFDDCIIVVATQASVSNRVIRADGTKDIPAVELFTMAQSQESTGSTDTFGQSAEQKPTTDVKPQTDLRYNDAIGAGGAAAKTFARSLTEGGLTLLSDYIKNKKSGTITLEKKDGTTETVTCENGICKTANGTVLNAETCPDCVDTAK